jgi:hypothetical protein
MTVRNGGYPHGEFAGEQMEINIRSADIEVQPTFPLYNPVKDSFSQRHCHERGQCTAASLESRDLPMPTMQQ